MQGIAVYSQGKEKFQPKARAELLRLQKSLTFIFFYIHSGVLLYFTPIKGCFGRRVVLVCVVYFQFSLGFDSRALCPQTNIAL